MPRKSCFMPAARHCFSRRGIGTAALAGVLLTLGACAGHAPSLSRTGTAVPARVEASRPANRATETPGRTTPASPTTVRIEAAAGDPEAGIAPGDLAWCRYLHARAEAKNALLLSPTVSASIDSDQRASAKISYDVVDVARARLERKSAAAACARYYAAEGITRMLQVVPQSLTYAGNLEKAAYLEARRGDLAAIERQVNAHVANGEITAQVAASLTQQIEAVRSLEFQARTESRRRDSVALLAGSNLAGLDHQLTEAERALQEADRLSRSLDALSVTLTAGVNHDADDDDPVFARDSAYAKVTVSYRLGALSPARDDYERLAEESRVAALSEPGHGSLWFTAETARTLARVREGLRDQRDQLQTAMVAAQRHAAKFRGSRDNDLLVSRYRAEVDAIRLAAELKGIEGTLRDIEKIERRLRMR